MVAAFDLESEQKRLSTLFAEINGASQTLHGGFLQVGGFAAVANSGDGSVDAQVQLVWSKKDLVNNATQKFHVQHHVRDVHGSAASVHRGIFPSSYDVALTSVSPSKRFVVTLKLEKGTDATAAPEGVFSLFEDSRLVTTFRTPKNVHGAIYLGEREGGIAWSHDERQIAYVAEKKSTESTPFWENVNSAKRTPDAGADKSKREDAAVLPGSKYVQEDDWGEQYVGKKTGVIFLATLATGQIDEVKGVPANLTCADVAFTPGDDGLVFAGTETASPKRLGIIYCYNRPITLYHLPLQLRSASDGDNADGTTKDDDTPEPVASKIAIKADDGAAQQIVSMRSPRFSPDGRSLAFLATRDVVTHNTCSLLAVLDWATKRVRTVIDIVDEPARGYSDHPTTAFNGLFTGALRRDAWSADSARLFFDTQVGTRFVWKVVDVASGHVVSPQYVDDVVGDATPQRVGVETILDRTGDVLLVSVSSPVRPASVFIVSVDLATGVYRRAPIVVEDQRQQQQHIGAWHVVPIATRVSDEPAAVARKQQQQQSETALLAEHDLLLASVSSDADFEATVLLPAQTPPAAGFPVVLDLHGGPHGNSPAAYRVLYEFFAALGIAVVSVNYRGSTGYGRRPLESLVGKVGVQDVFDCHYALQHVLASSGLPLDAQQLHCSGGSHGGFLVGHLIGQFPGVYRSTVARNPVTNIASMFYLTDIPDWTLGATGVARFESIHATQALQHGHAALPALAPAVRLAILSKLWQHSPVANDLSRVQTPVLFGIGGKDRRVPPSQALELRDSLVALGVETRTLWYPDDCHPLDSLQAFGDFSVNWALWVLQHN